MADDREAGPPPGADGAAAPPAAPGADPAPPSPSPPGAPQAAGPAGLPPGDIARILAVLAILLVGLSLLCVFGDWHVVKERRLLGAPGGDCAGRPCMEVLRETRTCKGTSHVPGLALLLCGLAIAAQGIFLGSRRRGLRIGMAITAISLGLIAATLPVVTTIAHLFDDADLASAGSQLTVLSLAAAGLAVAELVLTVRNAPEAPPPGASP